MLRTDPSLCHADPAAPQPTPATQQTLPAGLALPRHLHDDGYLAVVLRGRYWEAHGGGRRDLRPGDVAVHGPYSAHLNRVGSSADARVLNLRWPQALHDGFARVSDPDRLARALEQGTEPLAPLLASMLQPVPAPQADWPDRLAADLQRDPSLSLRDWAAAHGLAAESLSRGFQRAYGATPKRVRHEHRARLALQLLRSGSTPLVQAALASGFADQAGMTRAVRGLTRQTPGSLRREHGRSDPDH